MRSIGPAPRAMGRALRRSMILAPLGGAMLSGCVDAAVAPHVPAPPKDATPFFWSLQNDHRAITLSTVAPYDTLRIRALPRDGLGRPLDLEGTPTFVSSQPGRVQVSADGLVRAITPGTNVYVVSSLVAGNVRHVDTTVVHVTALASPPTVARFSVQPVPPDSTRWAVHQDPITLIPQFVKRPPLRVEDAAGKPITGIAVRYTSSDPVLAPIHSFNGEIKSQRLGRATFVAEATIYGTTWRDSVEYDFDWPVIGWAQIANMAKSGETPIPRIEPLTLRIGKGGVVVFSNFAGVPVGIVFEDPTHVAETVAPLECPPFPGRLEQTGRGDIPPFGGLPLSPLKDCQSRRFPVPGVYTYRTTPAGGTGKIIVEDTAP